LQRWSNYFHGMVEFMSGRQSRVDSMTCFRTEAGPTIELSGSRGLAYAGRHSGMVVDKMLTVFVRILFG
jgi:hypothetical protein